LSGHSKWSTIKHQKGVTDVRRGQLFTKVTREIAVAARQGGTDPESNIRLRLAIHRARTSNMPMDNIERAIKRGAGSGNNPNEDMDEVVYEGYSPGGAAILLQVFTNNRNRTASEIRSVFSRSGGSLGETGCVAWVFESKGVISLEAAANKAEEVALAAIDAGAEDFNLQGTLLEIYSSPDNLESLRLKLEEMGTTINSLEISMVPRSTIVLDRSTAGQTLKLLDRLEELDDIQRVYSNADFPDDVLENYHPGV
jgi:YebC/PmpR family DNA-binding regulatory protein